jgi:hypothetical protein
MNKKVLLVLAVVVLTANQTKAQFAFGVRAGVGLTNVYQRENDEMKVLDWNPGFNFGVVAEYALIDFLFLQPGISFSRQGMKTEKSANFGKNTATLTWDLNYIQIPINLQLRNRSGKLYVQVGPYLGYGISGKLKVEAVSGGKTESDSEKIDFGGKGTTVTDFKALDFGLGFGAGFRFGNLQTGLGLNYGLVNITPSKDVSMKNIGLALTAAYLFGK